MVYSRRLFKKVAVVTALILLTLILVGLWPSGSDEEALASVEVRRGNIEALVTATGVLQPRTYVDVGAQVSGQLESLHVQVGDEVKQGDLLAEIDPTVYLARVDGTRAQLRNQQAQLKDRKAQLTLADIQLQRQKNLFAEDATTREALQSAEASLRSAEAQIEALTAQIEQTQSTLRAEEANLEYAKIYAPMDGTVVTIDARQGQTLNASQTTPILMRIADLDTMSVQAQVSEADIGQLETGMPVYFTTLGNQGRRWEGELSRIEPTPLVENNVVLYYALFDVPNPGGRLLPQMTAQVFLSPAPLTMPWLFRYPHCAMGARSGVTPGRTPPAGDRRRCLWCVPVPRRSCGTCVSASPIGCTRKSCPVCVRASGFCSVDPRVVTGVSRVTASPGCSADAEHTHIEPVRGYQELP